MLMGVSLSTIRRMSEYGLCVTATITDQDLDALITQIKHIFPNSRFRLMQAHLRREGHRVTQIRIRRINVQREVVLDGQQSSNVINIL